MLQNLRRIPFFSELPDRELRAISEQLHCERYLKGQIIFSEGQAGDTLYLIESGQVQVLTGQPPDEKILAYLGPGNFFGELALLLNEPRSATVQVVIDAEVWVLHKKNLEALLEDYPSIALQMSRELSRRLVETSHMPARVEQCNLVTVVGAGADRLALSLARQTGQRVVLYDVGGLALAYGEREALQVTGVALQGGEVTHDSLAETLGHLVEAFDWVLMSGSPKRPEITARAIELTEATVLLDCAPAPWIVESARGKFWSSTTDPLALDRLARRIAQRTVGLALSSGGARGIAHIGVLRVLQNAGVPIDMLAGTSAGALFGTLYAAGLGLDEIEAFARRLPQTIQLKGRLWDFQIPPRSGIIWGRRTTRYLNQVLGHRAFADLKIPTYVVAADIVSGEQVVFYEGQVAPAVRASLSMIGIFVPAQIGDRFLVDGGAVNPLPVSVLAQQGADIIIGSSVIAGFQEEARFRRQVGGKGLNFFSIVSRQMALMEREIIKTRLGPANVLIQPRIETFTTMDYDKAVELIRVGEEAAQEALPRIQALIAPQPAPL